MTVEPFLHTSQSVLERGQIPLIAGSATVSMIQFDIQNGLNALYGII